jgi:hypothetical protein
MDDWRDAFITMSALLRDKSGEPIEKFEIGRDLPLAVELRDDDKTRRALSLARALGEIALEIENLEMEISS